MERSDPTVAERKAFSDFVSTVFVEQLASTMFPCKCISVGDHSWLISAPGCRSRRATSAHSLFIDASGLPLSRDLLGMALVYRNIWLDLTWSWLLSPSHFKLALHEAIEVLPNKSRMMIGGDNWRVEETYGAMKFAQRLDRRGPQRKIADGYFSQSDAERLAKKSCAKTPSSFRLDLGPTMNV